MSLLEQTEDVFRQLFDDDSIALDPAMTAKDIEGWDSLMHVNLVIALERRFKIKFATAEISALKADGQNIGSLLALLARKTGGDPARGV